ncbi:MAG: hypothetical protein SXA11_22895 [Cyanobacteriota bacterium]|nr:hypothetical protein [Cyanobacteriota bacterium]
MQPSIEFLTAEESVRVDAALLSSKEKFSTRLAIYALRCLKQIGKEKGKSVEEVTAEEAIAWIEGDEQIKEQLDLDSSFKDFFTRLVMASQRPLNQIASEAGVPLEDLTLELVVQWFEKQAKIRVEGG